MRCLVRSPAHKLRAVAEASAGDMIVAHLNDQFRLQRLPLRRALGGPAARTSRRVARESDASAQGFEFLRKCGAVHSREGRGEADMIELALRIVDAKQERTHE